MSVTKQAEILLEENESLKAFADRLEMKNEQLKVSGISILLCFQRYTDESIDREDWDHSKVAGSMQ